MGSSLPPVGVRFQAQGVPQVQAVFQQVAVSGQRAGQSISRTFTTATGQVSSFGRASVTAFTASGFALSQLASTGKVGFRELATATAGFAAFFGPAGLIVAGVAAAGTALADFFQRTREQVRATKDEVKELVRAAALREDPLLPQREALERHEANVRAIVGRIQRAMAPVRGSLAGGDPTLAAIGGAAPAPDLARLRSQLTEAITARNEALQRLVEAEKRQGGERTTTQRTVSRDVAKSIEQEIAALSALGEAQLLTGADMARALALHRQYATAVRDGTRALLERADALAKAKALEGAIAIPGVAVRPGIGRAGGARGPAGQIRISAADQARLGAAATDQFHTQGAFSGFQQELAAGIGTAIATGVTAGFTQGLASGSLTKGAAALGDAMSSALGGIFVQVGTQALIASQIMQQLVTALASLSPWVAIPAAIALIALGQSMGAAGRGIGGGGGVTSTFSGGTADGNATARRVILDPNALVNTLRERVTPREAGPQITVLGVETPLGQRVLATGVAGARRRGIK